MKYQITVKNDYVEFSFGKVKLKDIVVHTLGGSMRADYLLEQLKDYNNYPNKFLDARVVEESMKKQFGKIPKKG